MATDEPIYRIRNWAKHFENSRTRTLQKLRWVPISNDASGENYEELLDHENGPIHFACWIALVQMASKCEQRGVLVRVRNGTRLAHDCHSMARVSKIDRKWFREAIPRLLLIGWLETVDRNEISDWLDESIYVSPETEPEGKSQPSSQEQVTEERHSSARVGRASATRVPPECHPSDTLDGTFSRRKEGRKEGRKVKQSASITGSSASDRNAHLGRLGASKRLGKKSPKLPEENDFEEIQQRASDVVGRLGSIKADERLAVARAAWLSLAQFSDDWLFDAIEAVLHQKPSEPISYLTGTLRSKAVNVFRMQRSDFEALWTGTTFDGAFLKTIQLRPPPDD